MGKGGGQAFFFFGYYSRVGWLVVLGLTALLDSISVLNGSSPKEREKEREEKG